MGKFGFKSEKGNLVPLKAVSVEIQISGFVAHVISSLHYENNEDTPIEAEFTFPLDDGSAVYKFEAVIDSRHIVAECQEKEEAKKTYDDAIAAGNTALLLEEDDSSGDIFRCLVGNLPPKTEAKLLIGYVIELPVEHDGKLRFTLPVILNPRYSPNLGGLESAKGATYVVKQKDIPYSFKLTATVDGPKQIKSVTASQPHIEVEQGDERKTAKVVFTEDFTFDADVRLFVEYENPFDAECMVENGNSEKSGFLGERVLMVNLFTKVDTVGTTNKGEYIFVLDRSGSMGFGKNRIESAREALLLFLKSLPVGCYFNIVSFGSSHEFLFTDGSKEYTESTLKTALDVLKKMNADMGGTEILRPLQAIYKKDIIKGQPRQIFLLTDGEVGNVKEVIKIAKKNSSNTRVFSIGIGEGASTALVNGVARAGNGKAEFIKDSERMQPKVVSLLKFAMQPSITDVSIGWELPPGVEAITMPEMPPSLFDGDRLVLYALLQGHKESQISGKVYINGKTDKGPANFSADFFDDKSTEVSGFAPLHRLAAKAQIKLLEDKEGENEDTKNQIITLSVASNMTSKHTSFVAIDQERKEKVVGKHVRRNVPVMEDRSMMTHLMYCSSAPLSRATPRTRKIYTRSSEDSFVDLSEAMSGAPPPTARHAFSSRISSASKSKSKVTMASSTAMDLSRGRQSQITDMLGAHVDDAMGVEFGCDDEDDITPTLMSGDAMMDMISLQSFQGNWTLNGDVCKILKVESKVLKGLNLSQNDDVLATLAVLVWLDLNFQGRHNEWEMLETKAIAWLSAQGMGEAAVRDNKKTIHDSLAATMKV